MKAIETREAQRNERLQSLPSINKKC